MKNIKNVTIISSGEELAFYFYNKKAEMDLRDLFEEYFEVRKDWNNEKIEQFFKEHTALEYFHQLLEEKKYNRPENYFKQFRKYKTDNEIDDFLAFCNDDFYNFFERDPDFILDTETKERFPMIEYKGYSSSGIYVILTENDYSNYPEIIDIIKKFYNDKLFKIYFTSLDKYNEQDYFTPLRDKINRYKYVVHYRGGSGYYYHTWAYIPSLKRR
jgi:hypothetical protein